MNEVYDRDDIFKPKPKKSILKKVWYFIWHDNSIWSWIANIIIAFVLIKFIIYPLLGFILGTGFPIVAVVSGSMEHDGTFDQWWASQANCNEKRCTQGEYYGYFGIDKFKFREFPFKNGFNTGDIMILYRADGVKVGDVIVYRTNYQKEPIIHRVIKIDKNNQTDRNNQIYYTTKGDHNYNAYNFESKISQDQLLGKALFRVPYLGYIKIGFVKLLEIFI